MRYVTTLTYTLMVSQFDSQGEPGDVRELKLLFGRHAGTPLTVNLDPE